MKKKNYINLGIYELICILRTDCFNKYASLVLKNSVISSYLGKKEVGGERVQGKNSHNLGFALILPFVVSLHQELPLSARAK